MIISITNEKNTPRIPSKRFIEQYYYFFVPFPCTVLTFTRVTINLFLYFQPHLSELLLLELGHFYFHLLILLLYVRAPLTTWSCLTKLKTAAWFGWWFRTFDHVLRTNTLFTADSRTV